MMGINKLRNSNPLIPKPPYLRIGPLTEPRPGTSIARVWWYSYMMRYFSLLRKREF